MLERYIGIRNQRVKKAKARILINAFFVFIIFFAAQHDINFVRVQGNHNNLGSSYAQQAEEGNIYRQIAFVTLGLIGLFNLIKRTGKVFKLQNNIGWLLIIYISWIFISVSWSGNPQLTLRRSIVFFLVILGASGINRLFTSQNILYLTCFCTTMYLVIGILAEIIFGTFRPLYADYRFAGTTHYNVQGINCALLVISSYVAWRNAKKGKQLFFCLEVLGIAFLLLTKSRTAFASLIIAFVFYKILRSNLSRKTIWTGVVIFVYGALVLFKGEFFPINRKLVLLGREDADVYTLTGRMPLWKESFGYAGNRIFLGYGYNSFLTPERILQLSYSQNWGISELHSAYLETLLGVGLIGLGVSILILFICVKKSLGSTAKINKINYEFNGIFLIFYALDGILESGAVYPTFLLFIYVIAITRIAFCCSCERGKKPR